MSGEPASTISEADVEALRQLLIFARSKDGLALRRLELISAAGVRGPDLDNFISTVRSTGLYKTKRPHERLLFRLLKFVATEQRLRDALSAEHDLGPSLARVMSVYHALPTYSTDDDHLFVYLNRIHAMDEQKCLALCSHLSGNYFGYRFSANPKKIIRSHFEIKKFDPTRKIPNFIHHMKYQDGPVRLTLGQILDIGTNYVFTGFVCAGPDEYEGVKLIVMHKGMFGFSKKFTGLFISYAGEAGHQMGIIQLVRTKENYNPEKVGEFSLEKILRDDSSFDVQSLRKNVSGSIDDGCLVGALTV
jgi:hypothetical protein